MSLRSVLFVFALIDLVACGGDAGQALDAGPTADAPSGDAPSADAPALVPVAHTTIAPYVDSCVTAPTGYGAYGTVTSYDRFELQNPAWAGSSTPVEVLVPSGGSAPHPVLFYAHPFGGTDWTRARAFLEFLVSHDYVVMYVPYPTTGVTVCARYDVLWSGISTAVSRLGDQARIDTTRFGVIGHSFGGGASPWIARQALAAGWGANGSFVHANAPWYTYRMDAAGWSALADTRLLMMVFDDDTTNDHRIAIEQTFTPWQGPREYLHLVSGTQGTCSQTADHVVPNSTTLNGLDTWGTWRHAEALAACALRGTAAACALVDGATAQEQEMGNWISTATPAPTAIGTDAPQPVHAQSTYQFPLDDAANHPCDGTGLAP